MSKFLCIVLLLAILISVAESSNCSLKKKKFKKKIKKYQKQCLNKGFKSSVGCQSISKKLGKKASKKCKRLENVLEECGFSCPVVGGWSDFGEWTDCSVSCGGGEQTRNRTCTNPAPAHGGDDCEGEAEESQDCNEISCPINGGWAEWGDWSKCSAQCGGGRQTRKRSCNNPAPAHGGKECSTNSAESKSCNTQPCPS